MYERQALYFWEMFMELSESPQEKKNASEVNGLDEANEPQELDRASGPDEASRVKPAHTTSVSPARNYAPFIEVKKPSEDRIIMLSDGIFAIAVTLLVLSIQISFPDTNYPNAAAYQAAQNAFTAILMNSFFNHTMYYIITFAVLAAYWLNHRNLMMLVKRIDRPFLFLNLLFLAFVAFFPVASNLLKYSQFPQAVIVYTCVLAGCGYSSLLLWIYAFHRHRLVANEMDTDIRRSGIIGAASAPTFFLLSLLLFFIPGFAPNNLFYFWVLLPVLSIFMRRSGLFNNASRQREAKKDTNNL